MVLRVPRPLMDDMIAHAGEALPNEAVGLLGGVDQQVQRRIALPNVLGPYTFLVDPYAQYQALRQLQTAALQPLAIYHSHPAGGVRPSEDDLHFASRLPYVQVIIALGRPNNLRVEIAAFKVTGPMVRDVALDVTDD
jgi:proteasome lid subunit RPN8/RPN11